MLENQQVGKIMVKKNYINLLNELREIRDSELIILASYSFDPLFFNHMLLRELRENNPKSDILVLIDEQHVNLEECRWVSGLDYILIPLPSTFHSKLFVFCSKHENVVYIGSHNLTLTGFAHNLELYCKITDSYIFNMCVDYIKLVLSRYLNQNHEILNKISKFIRNDLVVESPTQLNFIHNLDEPILSKTLSLLKTKGVSVREVLIIAPFFSSVRQLLDLIVSKADSPRITLCIQRNNHNLDVQDLEDFSQVKVAEVEPAAPKRRIHFKLILFKTDRKEYLLIGSPNFTRSAMIETAGQKNGNYETAVLIERSTFSDILSELKFRNIQKNEIKSTKRIETQAKTERTNVHLLLAYQELLQLKINLMSSISSTDIHAVVEYPSGESYTHETPLKIAPDDKEIAIDLSKESTSGSLLWLSLNGAQISNKIPISIPYERRRLAIEPKNFRQISSMFANTKSLEDFISMILRLFPLEERKDLAHFPKSTRDSVSHGPILRPKKSILDIVEDLLKVPSLEISQTHRSEYPTAITFQPRHEIALHERIRRILQRLAEVFAERVLNSENTPSSYFLLALILFKFCESACSLFNLYDTFENLLSGSINDFEKLIEEYGLSDDDATELLSLILYLEKEWNCRVSVSTFKEITNRCNLCPLSFPDMVKRIQQKTDTTVNTLNSLQLPVSNETFDYCRDRISEIIWRIGTQERLPWKYLTKTKELVLDLAHDYFSTINSLDSMPFDVFLNATRGSEMAIGEMEVHYGYYPHKITREGFPSFTLNSDNWARVLEMTCEKLWNNLLAGLQDQDARNLILDEKICHQLKLCLRKEVETTLLEEKSDQEYTIIPGRLFNKIDYSKPTR